MRQYILRWLGAGLALWALVLGVGAAQAHATVVIEGYAVEYGWLAEPPLAGQPNAIILNLTAANPTDTAPLDERVSGLNFMVAYGDQTRTLALQAAPGGLPGQYILPLTPSLPGVYTLSIQGRLEGRLGLVAVDVAVTPEEVLPLAAVAFPRLPAPANNEGWALGLSAAALVLAGAALGVSLWRKR